MKISIGSDHGAVELRQALAHFLKQSAFTLIDHGTHSSTSVDYPDFAQLVGSDIVAGRAQYGILICTTGVGMSIAANKIVGIRAALVHNLIDAEFARRHNNANVICFGARHETPDQAIAYTKIFIDTHFESGNRHYRRVEKLESKPCCADSIETKRIPQH